jgi:hypothetical protein
MKLARRANGVPDYPPGHFIWRPTPEGFFVMRTNAKIFFVIGRLFRSPCTKVTSDQDCELLNHFKMIFFVLSCDCHCENKEFHGRGLQIRAKFTY